MKRIKYLLLFVGTALFLAACGGGGGNGGDQNGTLAIALDGVSSAPVVVSNASGDVVDETVADGDTFTLAAGSYTVTGGAVDGYTAPGAQNVTVTVGGTTDVTLTYTLVGGGDPDPDSDPDADPGIYVSLNPFGVRDAGTTLTLTDYESGDVVATTSGVGAPYFGVDAGLYVVTAERDGYGTVSREVEHGDGVTSVSITLLSDADAGIPGGNVEPGSVTFSYIDVNGYPFYSTKEINPEKDVDLLVAQTEDRICVTVSTGVSNAIVDVDITNTLFDSVAIVADSCTEEVELTAASASTRSFQADGNGDVQFSLFSTNALPWFELLDLIGLREPIKIVVSARGADGRADISEFKVFFLNMSHLYFGHGEYYEAPYDMIDDAVEAWLANPTVRMDDRVHTGQRWGRDFGSITNIWGATDTNSHFFGTGAAQKQPFTFAPFGLGEGFVHEDFGGRVVYSIVGGDTDLVEWVSGMDCVVSGDDCEIAYGSGNYMAQLAPVAGIGLEDLPFQVDIEVTYYHDVSYGPHDYSFPLKQYTVSKQWVGGFLEIDKYVDQHVLTWRGYDSDARASETLDAYDEPIIDGEEFTSTVHVTVTNSSDSPIYNVAVRDGVPAELGVIVDSISNGGTYDITNHTVTWNFNNTPELQEIGVGESYTFTFDVYARHKPGYCWDGAGDDNFTVQPIYPLGDPAGDPPVAECFDPYPDPYLVTNGLQANSVTAAGFFTDDVTSPQYVFSYQPVADESDIWVVRPLFELSKELRSQNLVTVGGSAFFDIEVAQLDRVDREASYGALHALYPWEFDNADTTSGTGHDADSSAARNNPYAYDVDVDDWFDVGIDFTNGTNFTNVTGGVIDITNIVDKNFSWTPIDSLPVGVTAASVVTFSTNLPSFTFNGVVGDYDDITPADGANGLVTVEIDGDEYELPAWQNCAYLTSLQLNQPADSDATDFSTTWYAANYTPWDQDEVLSSIYDRPAATFPALEDCDAVAVLPVPPTAFMAHTTNGEYTDVDDGDFDPGDLRDGYDSGELFYYVLTSESSGAADATDVVITGSLSNARVRFVNEADLYIGTEGSWTHVETITFVGYEGSFAFAPVDVPTGEFARVIVNAEARAQGVVDMNSQLTYTNGPDWQPLPLTVREETSVQQ